MEELIKMYFDACGLERASTPKGEKSRGHYLAAIPLPAGFNLGLGAWNQISL